MTKFPIAYVKSCDGQTWYVGDKPLQPDAGPCDQLQGYIYRASDYGQPPTADRSPFDRAMSYARHVGREVVVQSMVAA